MNERTNSHKGERWVLFETRDLGEKMSQVGGESRANVAVEGSNLFSFVLRGKRGEGPKLTRKGTHVFLAGRGSF